MDYLAIKQLHMGCAAVSLSLFLLRGAWMLKESVMLQRRWVRIVPHLVDTVLLGSAIMLVLISGQYPFAQAWLGAKVIALVLYIALGIVALKRGRTLRTRTLAFGAALLTFAYIVMVAITRQAIPF